MKAKIKIATYETTLLNIKNLETTFEPPKHVTPHHSYYSLSHRVTTKCNHDFVLTYSLKTESQAKRLTQGGIVPLFAIISIFYNSVFYSTTS